MLRVQEGMETSDLSQQESSQIRELQIWRAADTSVPIRRAAASHPTPGEKQQKPPVMVSLLLMRIIAGEYRSRRIDSVPGLDVRPTPDRLRESLFNILTPLLPGAVFVDAYAGSGSVGIEAISRGARKVLFLEKDKTALSVIDGNLKLLKVPGNRFAVLRGKAAENLETIEPADIIFFDPPYDREKEYAACLANASAPLVIAQHSFKLKLPEKTERLERFRELTQGDNILSFYRPAHPVSPVEETQQLPAVKPDE